MKPTDAPNRCRNQQCDGQTFETEDYVGIASVACVADGTRPRRPQAGGPGWRCAKCGTRWVAARRSADFVYLGENGKPCQHSQQSNWLSTKEDGATRRR